MRVLILFTVPEIEQGLSEAANSKVTVSFTPHLMPMVIAEFSSSSSSFPAQQVILLGCVFFTCVTFFDTEPWYAIDYLCGNGSRSDNSGFERTPW